jgi:hypothetical protein
MHAAALLQHIGVSRGRLNQKVKRLAAVLDRGETYSLSIPGFFRVGVVMQVAFARNSFAVVGAS